MLLVLAAIFQARRGGLPMPFDGFFLATAASFAFTLASAMGLRAGLLRPIAARLQPAWDVAYATVLVYLSGGAFSPFASLYPLAILGGAILLFRRGAFVVATASSVAYGLLVDLQFYGIVRPLNPFPLPEESGAKLLLQLLFNVVAFYAVALLSGYLAEELRRTGERLEMAEGEVLDLERLKESILHSLSSGLVALDGQGRELFHNEAAEEHLARGGIEFAQGMDFSEWFNLAGGERSEVSLRDGSVILGYSVSPLHDREGEPRGSILIFQDLTSVKRLEEDLRRSDRLAAVGRLAAGLAHEVRNPLASLAGSVEILRQSVSREGEGATLFGIVLRETERLNRLVTNFLHYARPGTHQKAPFPLRDLVEETAFFFSQGEGKKGFSLENQVPGEVKFRGDRGQMEQLLLNLFRNSAEASSHSVTVHVEASQSNGSIELTVRDDGPGIPREKEAHIFEPFFSDKEGGTGLGLATVHRIVENHGGTVRLEAVSGRGAAFHFRFPQADSWNASS